MLAGWTTGNLLVHLQGRITAPAVACVWAGQAVATGVILHALLSGNQPSIRWLKAGLDLLIVAIVLILIGAQILTTGASGSASLTAVLVSGLDVVLFGLLVWFAASRRFLGRAIDL